MSSVRPGACSLQHLGRVAPLPGAQQVVVVRKACQRVARSQTSPPASGLGAWPAVAACPTWPRTLHRPVVCGFLPFGRSIFDGMNGSAAEPATAAPALQSNEDAAPAASPPAPFSPFSVFVALLAARLRSRHSATPSAQDQGTVLPPATDIPQTVMSALASWGTFPPQHKVLVYEWLRSLCADMNAAYPGAWADNMVVGVVAQQLRQPCLGLPPSTYSALDRLLDTLATLEQQQHASAQEGSGEHLWPDQHMALQQHIMQDEGNQVALLRTLQAMGEVALAPAASLPAGQPHSLPVDQAQLQQTSTPGQQQDLQPPDVRLVTHLRPSAGQQQAFWHDFVGKCRLAWDVFFPEKQVLSPAGAMRARLQMILVSDRSGLDLPTLMHIRNSSFKALAQSNGWTDVSELELQVASQRASGEAVKVALPLSQIPAPWQLRAAAEYDYEDDDDYEEEEDGPHHVSGIAELEGAPAVRQISGP